MLLTVPAHVITDLENTLFELMVLFAIIGVLSVIALVMAFASCTVSVSKKAQPVARDASRVTLKGGELVFIDDDLLEELGDLYVQSGVGGTTSTFYHYVTRVAVARKARFAVLKGALL